MDISKSRNISVTKLNEIANGLLARTPEMAKNTKLIDKVAYEDEYHDDIKKALNTLFPSQKLIHIHKLKKEKIFKIFSLFPFQFF